MSVRGFYRRPQLQDYAGRTRRRSRTHLLPVLAAVFAVAVAVRLGPVLVHGSLRGLLEYDDGVYLAAADRLVAGAMPYRDFVFVQPPGVVVALAPLALLAHVVGDSNALVIARLLFIAIGAANAVLVARLAAIYGTTAAAASGLVYAGWGATAWAERTVLLEPVLNLGLLVAVTLLLRSPLTRRRALGAGLAIGVAALFKLWAAPVGLCIAVWLLHISPRRRQLKWYLAGCVAPWAIGALPFFAAAPGQMWREVVVDQLGRPRVDTVAHRFGLFAGVGTLPKLLPSAAVCLLAAAVLIVVVVLAWGAPGGRLWSAIAGAQIAVLVFAPAFFYHYTDFAGASLAMLIGLAFSRAVRSTRGGVRALLVVGASSVWLGLAVVAMQRAVLPSVDNSSLRHFASAHRCVWTASASLAILADAETRAINHGCGYQVDLYGVLLDSAGRRRSGEPLAQRPEIEQWQRVVQSELRRSDGAILDGPVTGQGWSRQTREVFFHRFRRVGNVGGIRLWTLARLS